MRERSLVLAHQVNDVTQRLNGHLVALQCGHNDLPQLLNDTGMVGRGDGNIRECGHDLATERCQLLGASPAALTGIKRQKPKQQVQQKEAVSYSKPIIMSVLRTEKLNK